MKNTTLLKISNSIAFFTMIFVNYLSNALPINGNTAGELSDKYVNYFVPAGATFAIWGVIYGWLTVFIVYQIASIFVKSLTVKVDEIVEKIGWFFVVSCILNITWLLAWHYEMVLFSVLLMILYLVVLAYIFIKTNNGKSKTNSLEKWISHVPLSINLGWISIATIANITALLVTLQWNGFGIDNAMWAKIMIIIGLIVTAYITLTSNAIFFGVTVMWAYWGIHLKRNMVGDAVSLSIESVAFFGIGVVLLLVIFRAKKWFAY